MRAVNFLLCVVGLTVFFTTNARANVADVQVDWKNALLPCSCDNGTTDCSYRSKDAIDAEDFCDRTTVSVNLYNNFLVTFPYGFASAVSVNASRNRLRMLPSASQVNPRLLVLDLSQNMISNASNELSELAFLEMLNLNTNKLTHLRFLPESCALKRLYVSGNSLVDLEGPLKQCTHLLLLDLSKNKLRSLPEGIFSRLSDLEVLHLGDNTIISGLTSNPFTTLTKLNELDLFRVGLTNVPRGIFNSLVMLEKLNIGSNALTLVPKNAFSSLTNLKILDMSCTNLQSFPSDVLATVPTLETLHLAYNFFSTLSSDAFLYLPQIKFLFLDYINISSIPEDIFSSLSELRILSLQGNHLTYLPNGLLKRLTKLEVIDLASNPWSELPLAALMNVKYIYFGSSGINSLGRGAFSAAPLLVSIDMFHNNISIIAEDAFGGQTFLENLNLGSNALAELPVNIFRGLAKLKRLNLSHNSLVRLPENIFWSLNNLKNLTLAGNMIETLPDLVFERLSTLEILDLSGNELTDVNPSIFNSLQSLRRLSLMNNRFRSLPGVSHAHTALLDVSFKGNSITQPNEKVLLQWLIGEGHCFIDLTENGVSALAVRWLVSEHQMRLTTDPASPCNCGFVRYRRVVLHLCIAATCPSEAKPGTWMDIMRHI